MKHISVTAKYSISKLQAALLAHLLPSRRSQSTLLILKGIIDVGQCIQKQTLIFKKENN